MKAYSGLVQRGEDEIMPVAGDGDYVPVLHELRTEGFVVHVAFWNNATRETKDAAAKFVSLDQYFGLLSRSRQPGTAVIGLGLIHFSRRLGA